MPIATLDAVLLIDGAIQFRSPSVLCTAWVLVSERERASLIVQRIDYGRWSLQVYPASIFLD